MGRKRADADDPPEPPKERERRLHRIESMMLRGIKSPELIANAFGLTVQRISTDIKEVRRRWGERDPDEREVLRAEKIAQLDSLLQLSLNAFDRSRKDVEEFSIAIRPCEVCNGAGVKANPSTGIDERCRQCGGKGKLVSETTKVKESPGDPAFLKLAKEIVVEVARFQGLVADGKLGILQKITTQEGVGGELREQTDLLYAEAPVDSLIAVMAAIDKLKHHKNQQQPEPARIIETSVSPAQTYNEGQEDTNT